MVPDRLDLFGLGGVIVVVVVVWSELLAFWEGGGWSWGLSGLFWYHGLFVEGMRGTYLEEFLVGLHGDFYD